MLRLSGLKGFCHGERFIKLQRIRELGSFECLLLEGSWNAEVSLRRLWHREDLSRFGL